MDSEVLDGVLERAPAGVLRLEGGEDSLLELPIVHRGGVELVGVVADSAPNLFRARFDSLYPAAIRRAHHVDRAVEGDAPEIHHARQQRSLGLELDHRVAPHEREALGRRGRDPSEPEAWRLLPGTTADEDEHRESVPVARQLSP